MEELEYLIRTLTYKKSCLELDCKEAVKKSKFAECVGLQGQIYGLHIAILEAYKILNEK